MRHITTTKTTTIRNTSAIAAVTATWIESVAGGELMTTRICDLSGDLLLEALGDSLRGANLECCDLTRANLINANLTGANMIDADLKCADLRRADLTGTHMTRVDMEGAYLAGTALTGANLIGANMVFADLTGANLMGANLTGAVLTGANLMGANLADANLTCAKMTFADLTGAHLRNARLTREQLNSANTSAIQADIYRILALAPTDVPRLLEALRAGRINGSASEGECASLVGTLSRGNDISIPRDSYSPAEVWFMAIHKGDTPETSAIAAVTAAWIETWLEVNT